MIFMDADEELDIDGIDIDGDDYDEPDIEGTEVDELKPDSVAVQQSQATVRKRIVSRYAGQLNAIELAKAVRDEITPLTGAAEQQLLAKAAVTKLTLDILAENVKPKSVREAAQAIETLSRLTGALAESNPQGPAARFQTFESVKMVIAQLERTTGGQNIPEITREAIEVTASED